MTTKTKRSLSGETVRMGLRSRGWFGQRPRASEEHRREMARARSARYRQSLDARNEPTNDVIAAALLAAYACVATQEGATLRTLHEALVMRLVERGYDTGLAAKRIARIRKATKAFPCEKV